MNLPDDCKFTYIILHETYYHSAEPHRIWIGATTREGGAWEAAWEFTIEEHQLTSHRPVLNLTMFDDSWDAFEQIPEFFTALHQHHPTTLIELQSLLDDVGAVDATPRTNPHRSPHG